MSCEGDGVEGFNTEAICYRLEGCPGCEKCQIKCEPKCENCPTWPEKPRPAEPGDWVTVQMPILDLTFKGKWVPAMNDAVGRLAWVKNGNPVDGFILKFTTTEKDVLDQFRYPLSALRLAMKKDVQIDQLIHDAKDSFNERM